MYLACLGAHERYNVTKKHTGAPRRHFALQKCMPERRDTVLHYKNAYRSLRTPLRITKMHAGASRHRFALQKCMPERPGTVSHCKNTRSSVRKPFRISKMQPGASGSVSHYKNAGRSSRLAKVLVLPKKNVEKQSGACSAPPPTHWREHKNVTVRISAVFPRVLQRKRD